MKTKKKTVLFLDSVIIDEIRKFSWLISGITTTPTFFKRDNINFDDFVSTIRKEFPHLELHVEALGPTPKETEKQLKTILKKKWFNINKIVIKIPADFENLKIISKYSKKGVKFNTHLIFNPFQAYLATLSGTTYVCPLIGRYADNMAKLDKNNIRGGENDIGKKLLLDVITTVDNGSSNKPVKTMASSIRTVDDFYNSLIAKVDVITIPTKILESSIKNKYTDQGIDTFLKDMGY